MNEPISATPAWTRVLLVACCVAAVAMATLVVGPPSQAQITTQRVITAENGVVQSTVSGDGTLQPATQDDVNFKTSGTLEHLYVSTGQHVFQGELLATLDPHQAEVGVQQAQAALASDEANLQQAEDAQANASSTSTTASATAADYASVADVAHSAVQSASGQTVSATPSPTTAASGPAPVNPAAGSPPTGTTGASAVTSTTTVTATTPGPSPATHPSSAAGVGSGAASQVLSGSSAPAGQSGSGAGENGSGGSSGGSSSATSAATLAANVASAEATVASARLSVESAEQTLADTRLYAPTSGTVASVADVQVGDTVSAGSASSGTADSGSSSATGALGGAAGGAGSSSAGASTSASSSSALVTIVNVAAMEVVVPLGESDIGRINVGQPATVTVDALSSLELAAHVTTVSLLGTTSSSVTSYDVTIALDQSDAQLRPGMSVTAQVIVSQAQGAVSVPSTAISQAGGQSTVTVRRDGKDVVTPVTTGVVGDSSTQILAGVSSGEQIVITMTTNAGSSSAAGSALGGSTTGTLGGAAGGLGGGGFPSGGFPSGGPPGVGG